MRTREASREIPFDCFFVVVLASKTPRPMNRAKASFHVKHTESSERPFGKGVAVGTEKGVLNICTRFIASPHAQRAQPTAPASLEAGGWRIR